MSGCSGFKLTYKGFEIIGYFRLGGMMRIYKAISIKIEIIWTEINPKSWNALCLWAL